MAFDGYLEQGTTLTISLGPFVDKDDGDTEKVGLTIEDTDVYLSVNGGAKGNPNDTNDCTEDANGVYRKQLDGTDTGTVGRLAVYVHFTDCLYVRQNYIVLDPEAYAGIVTGTAFGTDDKMLISTDAQDVSATLDVNTKTITAGIIANASFNSDVGSTAYATNIIALAGRKVLDELNLDHLAKIADSDDVVDDTIIAKLATKGATADWSDFVNTDDSLQAQRDRGDAAWITATGFATSGALTTHDNKLAPVSLDGGGTTIGGMLTKLADDNGGATFNATNDSLNVIRTRGDSVWVTATGFATSGALNTHDGKLDTAQTDLDKLTGTDGATLATAQGNYAPAKAGDLMGLANDAITSAKYDESSAFPLKSDDSGSTQVARTGADSDTLETLSDQLDTLTTQIGTAGDGLTDLGGMSTSMKAEINAEVLDVLNVDTYAEPGQGAPPAAPTIRQMAHYNYKQFRNKETQTATEHKLFADNGTTVDQLSTVSDDGTTFTKGEVGTGA